MAKVFQFLLVLMILQLVSSCKQDRAIPDQDFNVVIRIDRDIGRINPILSRTSRERDVYAYAFLNLGDYDPKTLELSPVLAESIPVKEELEDGRVKYSFRILENAVWENGRGIEASDFLFTTKLIAHPNITCPAWKIQLSNIDQILIDESDKKKFDVIVKQEDSNTLEGLCSFEIYPEHIYDSVGILSELSLDDLRDEVFVNGLVEQDSSFVKLAAEFSSTKYGTEIVEGAGPYKVYSWETDQYIRLQRKENWWGDQYPERTQLQAGPNELVFQIIADETTAITKLKAGEIDLMKITDGQAFSQLQSEFEGKLNFHTPRIQQYVYLAINNEDELMKYPEVRKALAMSIDLDNIVEVLEAGLAEPIVGTFESFASAYESNLSPIKQDVSKSKQLLKDNGWGDQNNNGTLDKSINGQLKELQIELLCSSDKSEKMALLTKDYAKDIGIDISIVRKTFRQILNDHVYKGDFQVFPMVSRWGLSPYDPFGRWHSDNAKTKGSNLSYYKSMQVDSLIGVLQTEFDDGERNKMFAQIEQIMHDDQPVIFLYSPLDKIVSSKKIKAFTANKRPGYFANLFELNQVESFSEN